MYMRMIVYYNMGAEKEHLCMTESAEGYYRKARNIAEMISNDYMKNKLDDILKKLNDNKI